MRRKIVIPVIFVVFICSYLSIDFEGYGQNLKSAQSFGIKMSGHVISVKQKDNNSFALEIQPISVGTNKELLNGNILITYRGILPEPWKVLHRDISFFSLLERPSPARNPNCFDYRLYLQSKGIGSIGTIKNYIILKEDSKNIFEKIDIWLTRLRWEFQKKIPAGSRGIMMGILFGETYYMDEDTLEIFRENGTAHVLTVSGLHMGIFFGIYSSISKRHRQSKVLKVIFALMLLFYGALSSWSPSVVRAVAMIFLRMAADLFDLRYDMVSALCLIAIVSIMKNPFVIHNPSFQMSCMAVISISLLMPVISKKIPDSIRLCMAANAGLLLYQMYQFNYISFVAVIANIPVMLLIGYILPLSIAYFLLVSFTNGIVSSGLSPISQGLSIMLVKVNEWVNFGGFRGIDVVSPPLFCCLLFGAGILFVSSETFYLLKSKKKIKIIVLIIVIFFAGISMISESSKCPVSKDDIVFVDVGQGDSIHVRTGNSNVLIDGGGMAGYMSYNVGKNTLKPYLLKNGVSKVDLAVATHKHTDHFQGIIELDSCFKVMDIRSELTMGDFVDLGKDMYIEVLWPLQIDNVKGQEDNSKCSVFLLNYHGIKVLIPGDLDETGERAMCDYYKGTGKLNADVLQVGHHGSRFSTTDEFLDAVTPRYAVIQVGKNNYGHPSPLVIEKLRKRDIIVYRNDMDGAVGLSVKEGQIEFHKMIG